MTKDDGKELLSIARSTLEKLVRREHTAKPAKYPISFNEKMGIFCAFYKNGKRRSRAVIGLPYPLMSLVDALTEAVKTAVTGDEKFPEITPDELAEVKIEISVLTEPQIIEAMYDAKILGNIAVGSDGLFLQFGMYESYLMPQAWEGTSSKEDFLSALCVKAGLDQDAWHDTEIHLYKFQAQSFREE